MVKMYFPFPYSCPLQIVHRVVMDNVTLPYSEITFCHIAIQPFLILFLMNAPKMLFEETISCVFIIKKSHVLLNISYLVIFHNHCAVCIHALRTLFELLAICKLC